MTEEFHDPDPRAELLWAAREGYEDHGYDDPDASAEAAVKAVERAAAARVYESVLRGLRSEDDSIQLRAIIASVEADASLK